MWSRGIAEQLKPWELPNRKPRQRETVIVHDQRTYPSSLPGRLGTGCVVSAGVAVVMFEATNGDVLDALSPPIVVTPATGRSRTRRGFH
jgi:hypothetical protein